MLVNLRAYDGKNQVADFKNLGLGFQVFYAFDCSDVELKDLENELEGFLIWDEG